MISSIKKLDKLLNKGQKIKLIFLTFLLIVGMLLEALGIGILIPFLESISNDGMSPNLNYLNEKLNASSKEELIKLILLAVLIVYTFKTIFLIFLNYRQNRFLFNLNADITYRLLRKYFNQSYDFFVQSSISKLHKHLHMDTSYFTTYCTSLVNLISEIGLLSSILISILIVEPFAAIFVGLLFIFLSFIFYSLSKRKLSTWGYRRKKIEEDLNKEILESLSGIKELMVFNKLEYFTEMFKKRKFSLSDLQSKFTTINLLPRYYLEFITVLVLVSFILLMLTFENSFSEIIPILGLFIAASFKMIPSLNKIIASFQNLKYYSSSIQILEKEFNLPEINRKIYQSNFTGSINKIVFENVNFNYDKSSKNILENINLKFEKNNLYGVIGNSGSGKTTLINMLAGLYFPTSGKIKINDSNILTISNRDVLRTKIGYISQKTFLLNSSIKENIAFGIPNDLIDENRVINSLKKAELLNLIKTLPGGIEYIVGESGGKFSGGQIQRLGIARALYIDPEVLILDESTNALDDFTEKNILKTLIDLKKNKIIIFISHKNNLHELYDSIIKIEKKSTKDQIN